MRLTPVDDRAGVDAVFRHSRRMPTTYPVSGLALGDPDALEDLARRCRRTANGLRADGVLLRSTTEHAQWSGSAATAFRRSVQHLPGELARAADSYDTVARALAAYAEDVRATARLARRVSDELSTIGAGVLAEQHALFGGVTGADAAARTRRVAALEVERSAAQCRLGTLSADLDHAAAVAARLVRSVSDAPREPPNVFERLADGVGDWVEGHAETLSDLSAALKVVSGVAGLLSLVPLLSSVMTPVAAVSGAAALLIDAALAARQRATWRGVAVGGALSLAGGSGLARFTVREVHLRTVSTRVYRVEGRPNQRILIDQQGDVRFQKRQMLYLNVGQRSRAEDYCRQKLLAGLPDAHLVAFRVRKAQIRELRSRAVDQSLSKQFPHAPHRVDVTQAPDQFGLWRHDFRELQKHILAGTGRVLRCG